MLFKKTLKGILLKNLTMLISPWIISITLIALIVWVTMTYVIK